MAGNYDKYGNYDFSMFEPKPVSFDHNAARKIATLPGVGSGSIDFTFYPELGKINFSLKSLITYISFFILSFLPFFIEVKENLKWKYYISKI